MTKRRLRPVWLLGAALVVTVGPAFAQPSDSILLAANAANVDSVRIAEYYARVRSVRPDAILQLSTLPSDPPDGIDRQVFERAILAPIAAFIGRNRAHDRILFIVLTKGIPLRINGAADSSTAASVDSELTLLYRRLTGVAVPLSGTVPNPLFLGPAPVSQAEPFTRESSDLYLVTRLDGYTVEDVQGLIDRAQTLSSAGRFLLDGKSSWTDKGNNWLRAAAERLRATGLAADRVAHDESGRVLTDQADVLGYYSWGSNDPAIRRRTFNLEFRPGAIGGMFVSTDARTFREPPKEWAVGNWQDRQTWFAGSPQSLVGDLVREGITGVAGHVSEPYLGNTIRPDILFPTYVAGFSLAEAFYFAMPSLSWQTVIVGEVGRDPAAPGRGLSQPRRRGRFGSGTCPGLDARSPTSVQP